MDAFVTGITGQDGHYLSEYLNSLGYKVYGLVRRHATEQEVPDGVEVVEGDLTDASCLEAVIRKIRPDETYNLGAITHVGESFKIPDTVMQVNALGCLYLLEAIRRYGGKFYQASTSELFGLSPAPQSEDTAFYPRSPYGIAKQAAYWYTVNYRESYGVWACNGILFNHESPRRGKDFVTQKVCTAAAEIALGVRDELLLGNLDAKRDWGHARDYVRGMHMMLQQTDPDDYVLATGESHTIRELLDEAFSYVGLDWKRYVKQDERFMRPAEVPDLRGNPAKARGIGWIPEYDFRSLIREMVDESLRKTNGVVQERKAEVGS